MQKRQDPRRVSPAEVCLGLAKATAVMLSVHADRRLVAVIPMGGMNRALSYGAWKST